MIITTPLAPAPDDILREANAHCEAHRFAQALALLEPLVGEDPVADDTTLAPALNLAALSATGTGDVARAGMLWQRCLAAKPDFVEAYSGLAGLYATLGSLAQAQALYERLLNLTPGDIDARSNLGVVLQRQERHAEAEATFRAVLAQCPTHADAHYNLGLLLQGQGRHTEAESALRAAIAANARHAKAYNGLGTQLRDQGRGDDAAEAFRQALLIQPQYPEALNNLAMLLKASGKLAEAELAVRLALQIRPRFVDALNNLGCVLTDLKRVPEAEAAFRVHKSDLGIRPVWHQREDRVQAHILVCFLTYVLWKTLAASCRQAGLGDEPRQVFEALSEIALVDVALPTRAGAVIRKRCISRPTEHQLILLQRLGLELPAALETAAM